jgi:hypothetical protein
MNAQGKGPIHISIERDFVRLRFMCESHIDLEQVAAVIPDKQTAARKINGGVLSLTIRIETYFLN